MREVLVLLGFALLASHELDAVTQSEWRLLFVLRDLPEALARDVFVVLHVPLFAGLVALLWHAGARLRSRARSVFAAFLVVHVAIHQHLSDHPLYLFDGVISQLLIVAAGLTGALFLLAQWRAGNR